MEALTSLGINGKMFIAQIINFLILLFILNKLLYKPILGMFDKRRETIEKGLEDAKEADKALAKAEDEAEKIKEKAYQESNEIIANSRKEAEEEAKAILADAHKHGEKIIQNASDEATSLKDSALKEVKGEISSLISMSLGKIIHNKLDDATREKLTGLAVKEIE